MDPNLPASPRPTFRVAVILPYRPTPPTEEHADDPRFNRRVQLMAFLRHMRGPFQKALGVATQGALQLFFVVVEQTGQEGFNRGLLLNAGAILVDRYKPAWLVLHDIDLLPDASCAAIAKLYATAPRASPIHLGALFARYAANPNYYGGALAILPEHLRAANGFPNTFFGWGGEDDALRTRLARVGLLSPQCPGRVLARDPEVPRLRDLEEAESFQDKSVRLSHPERCSRKHELRERDTRANTWVLDGICNAHFEILQTASEQTDIVHFLLRLAGGRCGGGGEGGGGGGAGETDTTTMMMDVEVDAGEEEPGSTTPVLPPPPDLCLL